MAFQGGQSIQLDEKNRMRVPAKFKDELGNKFVLCQGLDNCLYAMSQAAFEEFKQPYMQFPTYMKEGRRVLRALLGTVEIIEEDNQGRFVVPQELRQIAGIDKRVRVLGMGNLLEIWAEELLADEDFGKSGSVERASEKAFGGKAEA